MMKIYQSILLAALVLLTTASSCKEKQEPQPDDPETEVKAASFTVALDASAGDPFKTAWSEGDAVQVVGVKDGKTVEETMAVSSISSASAVITSKGTVKTDCEEYYAYVSGTGVTGFDTAADWKVSQTPSETRTVTVAKASKGASSLSFKNIYSFIKVNVTDEATKSIVLEGNNGETLNYAATVSAADYSVTAGASRGEMTASEDGKSVKAAVTEAGVCYINLVPGIVFEKGYTLTAYDAAGKALGKSEYSDKVTLEAGKVLTAGEIQPEKEPPVFTASFADTKTPEFKSSWSEGEAIEVACIVNDEYVTESLTASEVSADGRTAKFAASTLPGGASGYYAMIPGTGVAGYQKTNWSTANLDGDAIARPTVTVAACTGESTTLEFRNTFSLLSFKVDEAAVASVVLTGNNGEKVSKNMLVSFSSFNVNGNSTPTFTSAESLQKSVKPGVTCYFGLYPGLKLSKGYTLTAYNAAGKVIGYAKTSSSLTVEGGKVYTAPDFVITRPSEKTTTFDTKNIVLSLGVVSDVHINSSSAPTTKWKAALEQLKAKASESDQNGMAGVLVVGDLIDNPNNSWLNTFKTVLESEIDVTKTPMIYTIGNHDVPNYAWASSMVSDVAYIRNAFGDSYFQTDQDNDMRTKYEARHCVIGDYHILTISPNGDSPIMYDNTAVTWLDSQLKAITEEDPERYVIVLTHPMIYNTIYGSLLGEADGIWSSSLPHYWATDALTPVLKKYPQAVVFGGHLHFPLNDPRSVWQGDFTVFGCASTRYMALENGGYEDMASATTMKDCNEFSQGNLLQFDASGNMRVLRMDFYNKDVIGEPLVSRYPNTAKANLTQFNHTTRSLANGAPSLSTLDVNVEESAVTATWAAGKDDEFVHHYVLSLKKADGTVVSTKKILADFYKHPKTSGMKSEWSCSLGGLGNGSYVLSLVAYDSWDASSNTLSKTFNVGVSDSNIWTDDAAGSKTVAGGDGAVTSDWLSYSAGKVSWTANSTGRPRTASLTLPNGSVYSVTQISVEDLKGTWKLYSKLFDPNKTMGKGNTNADITEVTFGAPLVSQTLTDASGASHTNNLGIKGLYLDSTLDACVEIDYEAGKVKFGVFFDRRSAQAAGNGSYVAYLPECSTGYWNGYVFAPGSKAFSSTDYDWLWFTVSEDFSKLKYQYFNAGQKTANGTYYIAGISCVKGSSSSASTLGSNYDVIYQANYNGSNTESMYFTRN